MSGGPASGVGQFSFHFQWAPYLVRHSPATETMPRQQYQPAAGENARPPSQYAPPVQPESQSPVRWRWVGDTHPRHIYDLAPFSLWKRGEKRPRITNQDELSWLNRAYGAKNVFLHGDLFTITTNAPPNPLPLTVGGLPTVFAPHGRLPRPLTGNHPGNLKFPDPCSDMGWEPWSQPTQEDMVKVIEALIMIGNIRRVHFLPYITVVELEWSDDKMYSSVLLPGKVAGRHTVYHRSPLPYLENVRNRTREEILDPSQYTPVQLIGHVGYIGLGMSLSKEPTGEIADPYEVLDIGFKELGPHLNWLNPMYSPPGGPPNMIPGRDLFFEIDAYKREYITLNFIGRSMGKPLTPTGSPEIPINQWNRFDICRVFGADRPRALEWVCGLPVRCVIDGSVAGVLHLAAGDYTQFPVMRRLITEAERMGERIFAVPPGDPEDGDDYAKPTSLTRP